MVCVYHAYLLIRQLAHFADPDIHDLKIGSKLYLPANNTWFNK